MVPLGDSHWEEGNMDTMLDGRWSPAAGLCLAARVTLLQDSGSAAACHTASAHLTTIYGSGQDRFTLFPPQKSGFKIRTTFIRQASNPGQR